MAVNHAHARQAGTWLADDIVQGRTYFFQGPRGVIELTPALFEGVKTEERFDRARALLMGEDAILDLARPVAVPSEDGRREAVLLTAAMVFAAGADGVLAEEEARQLEAHFATVEELRTFAAKELMEAVRTEVFGLEGQVLEVAQEGERYVVSVRFTGSVREQPGAAPEPLDEVWHLAKPRWGNGGWVIAGIQQVATE